MLASIPASILNLTRARLGIPSDSKKPNPALVRTNDATSPSI